MSTEFKRPNIQIAKRKGADKFFADVMQFQETLVTSLTRDIKDNTERKIQMNALRNSHKYSLPRIIRKIVEHSIDTGLTPEEVFEV